MSSQRFCRVLQLLGLPILGFIKEISSLLRKLEAKKGRGVKVSRGRRKSKSSSRLEKEIRRLECSINYDSALTAIKGKGRGVRT